MTTAQSSKPSPRFAGLRPVRRPPLRAAPKPAAKLAAPRVSRPQRANPVHQIQAGLAAALAAPSDLDSPHLRAALRAARSLHRAKLAGVRAALLAGDLPPDQAAAALTRDADTCIAAMFQAVRDNCEMRLGPAPGACAVLGMGKFGGAELTVSSDIDMVVLFDRADPAARAGEGDDYFQALAQRLHGALSWDAAYGPLYDVDMRLRPHGADGPLAVSLPAFEHYYARERWTWELQALTRARLVCGSPGLSVEAERMIGEAITGAAAHPRRIRADVLAMRRTVAAEDRPLGPWDIKRARGGLMDLEFLVQGLRLSNARAGAAPFANTGDAIAALAAEGVLAGDAAADLFAAWRLYSDIRQLQAACRLDGRALNLAPVGQHGVLLRALKADSWAEALLRVRATQKRVRTLFSEGLGA